jgi:hypothetical protein
MHRMHLMSNLIMHTFQAIVAAGTVLLVQAVPENTSDWISMIERLGLAVALVIFFVWTGWKREARMAARIDYLEKEVTKTNAKLATLSALITETMDRDRETLSEMIETLKGRPCVAFKNTESFRRWQKTHEKE